jgi:hypothetical protein
LSDFAFQALRLLTSFVGMGRNDKHGSNTVDFGTGPNLKFTDSKQRVFSAAGGSWNQGFWHSQSDRSQQPIWCSFQLHSFPVRWNLSECKATDFQNNFRFPVTQE